MKRLVPPAFHSQMLRISFVDSRPLMHHHIRPPRKVNFPFRPSALLRTRLSTSKQQFNPYFFFLRQQVIQPHLPIRPPCYDLTPIIEPTFDCCLLAVSSQASGVPNFHGLTGGVYKARERIHRGMLIRDY